MNAHVQWGQSRYNEKPVTVRGVTYRSQAEAAKKLGVHTSTIAHAMKKGTLDNVGLHTYTKKDKEMFAQLVNASLHMLSGDPERVRKGIADMKTIHKALGVS